MLGELARLGEAGKQAEASYVSARLEAAQHAAEVRGVAGNEGVNPS